VSDGEKLRIILKLDVLMLERNFPGISQRLTSKKVIAEQTFVAMDAMTFRKLYMFHSSGENVGGVYYVRSNRKS
jgi:hypothetical protein